MSPGMKNTFAEVAVPLPVFKTYTYRVPDHLHGMVKPGVRVSVPFGKRNISGLVFAVKGESTLEKVHHLLDVIDHEPIFSETDLRFMLDTARLYGAPLGEILRTMTHPGFFREEKVRFRLTQRGRARVEDETAGDQGAWLRIFSGRGPLSRSHAERELKKIGLKAPASKLARMTAEGLIEQVHVLKMEVGARKTVFIEMGKEGAVRVTPQAEKLVEAVLKEGRIEKKQLLLMTSVSGSVLKRLVEGGLLAEVTVEDLDGGAEGHLEEEKADYELTGHQVEAISRISEAIRGDRHRVFLLHGVTGSGKTEVYLGAIENALNMGKGAYYLIPEIALTPLFLGRIQRRFGENVAVLHSRIPPSARRALWIRVRSGVTSLIIGARSSLFAPLSRPGIIIVDEEHDQAYKQDDGVKYNGRDLAIVKGRHYGIPVVLGSATPSGESYFRAKTGDFDYLELPERVAKSSLPRVEIVDLAKNRGKRGFKRYVSPQLEDGIESALSKNEKVMLFINRRGFSPWILCLDCGFVERCDDCSVSLTLHRHEESLICHYCGLRKQVPLVCPRCDGPKIAPVGIGTEKLEAFLNRKWKDRKVSRMDSDSTKRKGAYGSLLRSMQEGNIDLLVGTQMIAKGHDFPQVTLVGVIMADLSLAFPDFRSSERTFQLLTQVSGRAGRRGKVGSVIVQTFQPDHYAILKAAAHEYKEFMDIELSHRSELGYPPFSRLLLIRVSGAKQPGVEKRAQEVVETLYSRFDLRTDLKILGPSPAPIWKMKRQYIYQILVKSPPDADFSPLMDVINAEFGGGKRKGGIRVEFDVDPYQLMY